MMRWLVFCVPASVLEDQNFDPTEPADPVVIALGARLPPQAGSLQHRRAAHRRRHAEFSLTAAGKPLLSRALCVDVCLRYGPLLPSGPFRFLGGRSGA